MNGPSHNSFGSVLRRRGGVMLGLLVVAIVGAGCENYRYRLELEPQGEKMERRLTLSRSSQGGAGGKERQPRGPAEAELAHLRPLYESHEQLPEATHRYTGRFGPEMPGDVGGHGTYRRWTSRLGTLTAYVERFRGDDDLAGQFARRKKGAERLHGLLVVWLRGELGDDPGWKQLEAFLEGDFRRDLENVAAHAWLATALVNSAESDDAGSGKGGEESTPPGDTGRSPGEQIAVRMGQYLLERDYFTPEQLPALERAARQGDYSGLAAHVRWLVARRLGIPPTDAPPLPFLESSEWLKASIDRHLADTDVFRTALDEWEAETGQNAAGTPPHKLLGNAALQTIGLRFGGFDRVEVQLACPDAPFATNGRWNAEMGHVTWSATTATRGRPTNRALPVLCYASWAEPNEAAQRKHLGRVALTGRELGRYCLWESGLSDEERTEWTALLDSLEASPDVEARLKAFRFPSDPPALPDGNRPPSAADAARELLLEALGEEK